MANHRKYSWEKWFDRPRGEVITLVRGIDYNCSQSTMAGMVRNNASQRGLSVRLTDNGNSITVEVVGETNHTKTEIAISNQH